MPIRDEPVRTSSSWPAAAGFDCQKYAAPNNPRARLFAMTPNRLPVQGDNGLEGRGAVPFLDRYEAGNMLSGKLREYAGRPDAAVFALPRGGVPVGFEVARALDLPLDVFLVRKLGVPGHEELAMGALASGGVRVLNDEIVRSLGIPSEAIEEVATRESRELERREHEYRLQRPTAEVEGRTIILVDDGLATGSTMRAAVTALRRRRAGRIVVAVPVGAPETCRELHAIADEVVCLEAPEHFYAVGEWYFDFRPTSDEEVRALLERAEKERTSQYAKRD